MRTFTCSYRYGDRRYVVHLDAADRAEASPRLRAIGMTGQVDGELVAEVALEQPGGWLTRLRRLFGRSQS